jgi:hypothetical protein
LSDATYRACGQVTPNGCSKTLAPLATLTVSYHKTTASADLTLGQSLPPKAGPACALLRTDSARTSWQAHELAPPTDLTILLEHFII